MENSSYCSIYSSLDNQLFCLKSVANTYVELAKLYLGKGDVKAAKEKLFIAVRLFKYDSDNKSVSKYLHLLNNINNLFLKNSFEASQTFDLIFDSIQKKVYEKTKV